MVDEYKGLPESVIKQAATLQIKALDGELRMLKSRYQNPFQGATSNTVVSIGTVCRSRGCIAPAVQTTAE